MCVTAFYFNPSPPPDGFKLVVVFNRDEFYNRPTLPAEFWENTDVIAGRDLQQGREGGTWLGLNKSGRLALLLNIFEFSAQDPNARGRGSLVKDFILGHASPEEYTSYVCKEGALYNTFNLICMDLGNVEGSAFHCSNKGGNKPSKIEPGVHGCSNSAFDKPWPKACYVKSQLADAIDAHSTVEEAKLIQCLFDVFHNDQRLDGKDTKELENASLESHLELFSKILPNLIMIKSPYYGTRSTTVIVVKDNNEAVFVEKYLEEPIDRSNYQWKTKEHRFILRDGEHLLTTTT